jgi:hypothetical protein
MTAAKSSETKRAQHTPGEIRIEERTGGVVLLSESVGSLKADLGHYAVIGSATQRDPHPRHGGGVSLGTAFANARLWAQAPAMYDALRALLEIPALKALPNIGTGPVDDARAILAAIDGSAS